MNAATSRIRTLLWGTDREKAAVGAGLPHGLAGRLEGDTAEELAADARALVEGLDGWSHEPEPVRPPPDYEAGVKSVPVPAAGPNMNAVLLAGIRASRRRPTDDDIRHALDELS